jgi:serine/threonine-protein kinase
VEEPVPEKNISQPAGEPDPVARILAGRYRIAHEIARGGMGIVCLARDRELDMDVAVKLLPPELAGDSRALEQLRSEAKLSMSLAHPNILRLHNLDTSSKTKFLVMEYVNGPNLKYILQRRSRLTLDEALPIIRAVCNGLDYAHSRRVLHRDLKPANIMMTSKREVKIADFGIARRMKESMTELTQKVVAGTPLYMAPEHLMGKNLTVRSDMYSLAAVTYELLAGHPPFYKGDIPTQIRFKDPPPVPGIPEPVNLAILRALSKKPEDRPASAKKFYKTLTHATLQILPEPAPAKKPQPPQPAKRPAGIVPRRKRDISQPPPVVKPLPVPALRPQPVTQTERPAKRRKSPRPEFVLIIALLAVSAVGYYLYREFNLRLELAGLMQEADAALAQAGKAGAGEEAKDRLCTLLQMCETFKKNHPYSFKLLTENELDEKIITLRSRIKQIGK